MRNNIKAYRARRTVQNGQTIEPDTGIGDGMDLQACATTLSSATVRSCCGIEKDIGFYVWTSQLMSTKTYTPM